MGDGDTVCNYGSDSDFMEGGVVIALELTVIKLVITLSADVLSIRVMYS